MKDKSKSSLISSTGARGALRNSGRLILVLALLSQTIFVAGLSTASAQKKRTRKKKTTAEKQATRMQIVLPQLPQTKPAQTRPAPIEQSPAADSAASGRPEVSPKPKPVQAQDMQIRPIEAVSTAQVSFEALAQQDKLSPKSDEPPTGLAIHPPLTIDDSRGQPGAVGAPQSEKSEVIQPNVASPSPSANFLAQEDGPKVGTSTFTIPPDTMGAVGLDKIFTQTNSNFRIHDKTTGAPLSTVSSDTFWTASGGSGFFDPRVQYDPYNNRWVTAIVSNPQTANAAVEIGISDTSDPAGTYHLYRYVVGCAAGGTSPITGGACNAGGEWADFPMLGFSKGWVAVTWNQFTNAGAFINGRGIFIDYPNLRTGPVSPTTFTIFGLDFCAHPATTLDANQVNLYFAIHLSSGGATYRTYTLAGNPPSLGGTTPSVTATGAIVRPGGGWTQPSGDILPQQCVGTPGVTCPTTLRGINANDAFVRSNVIYRNGNLYYPQTINLPAGTAASADASRNAVQWTVVNASTGAFVDGGRVEDPTATKSNGGKHYAFGGLAVNKNGDILLGYSQFASNQFASAGYSFRATTDAAGTMRDPVIYKAGEDYYSKAFSGTQNRWGDYSHAAVDPVNDRDLWTIQEYAGTRTTPDANTTTNNSRWGTWWAKVSAAAGAGDLIISEFKLHGIGIDGSPSTGDDANDEFVEIYNTNSSPITVTTVDASAGYAVAASDGVVRCTIPNGTVIPGRGHYLCANSIGYSYANYPAGSGTATPDATYTTGIPLNQGIALFNTATPANFSLATRLDAVGSNLEVNTLYREGAGYAPIAIMATDHSFVRDMCGKAGSTTATGRCTQAGFPKDTNDNAADFIFVDTNGTLSAAGQRLGAPGPENLSSPIQRNSTMPGFLLDATTGSGAAPNRVRDFTPGSPATSTLGTLDIRRRIVNNTGAPVTRLRFRVIDISTFPVPPGFADLRAITSGDIVVSSVNDAGTCGAVQVPPAAPPTPPCTVTVRGTLLEIPPNQPNGGGFNSSLSAGAVTLATPLAPGQSINVRFLLGVQQTGTFKFIVNIEALP